MQRLRGRDRVLRARARASPSSTARMREGIARSASPASRRIRSATASARGRTSRRTRTRPAAARSRPAWFLQSSQDATGEGGGGLRVEDNFLITDGRRREALALPGWDRPGVTLDRVEGLDRRSERARRSSRSRASPSASTTRRCATASRRSASCSRPRTSSRSRRALDAAGVDRIEAGFPRVSEDDYARDRADPRRPGSSAEVWGFSRAVRADVEALVELGVQASVIESPISDGKLAALGVSRETMLERIRSAVVVRRGGRASGRVLRRRLDPRRPRVRPARRTRRAVEAGAQEVVVVDTLGIATPEAAAFLVGEVVERLDYEVPVHWHGHDDFGLATAAAVAAVQAGATWVQGTVNGMGERAGNADLVEVALALEALYGIPTRLDLDAGARALRSSCRSSPARRSPPWKPVTGDNLFTRESGAVAAQFHDPPAIEPYASRARRRRARDRAREEERARLDPDQGRRARARRARGAAPGALEAVKRAGTKKRGLVTDAEFTAAREPAGASRHVTQLTDMSRAPRILAASSVIERVCIVGAGVIGSLFAGHLARVCDVSVLTRRREHADALNARRASRQREERPPRARHGDRRPGGAPAVRRRDRRDEGVRARGGRGGARGALPGRDDRDRAQRDRRGGGRPRARRLADRLRRDVHERDAPLGHARRVHPRHGDVARPVRGHAVRDACRTSPTRSSRRA